MSVSWAVERIEGPTGNGLADELIAYWERSFGVSCERLRSVLEGRETSADLAVIYLVSHGGRTGREEILLPFRP